MTETVVLAVSDSYTFSIERRLECMSVPHPYTTLLVHSP